MKCLFCEKELEGKWAKKFCNRKCAATFNNRAKPKRVKKERHKCRECNNTVDHNRLVYCRECITKRKHFHGIPADEQTIEHASRRGGANRYDIIRNHARRIYRKELEGSCEKCGYDKHVELCHIKPISAFDKQTVIVDVNHRSNVVFLCPNCHWEFDHS